MVQWCLLLELGRLKPCFLLLFIAFPGGPAAPAGSCGVESRLTGWKGSTNNLGSRLSTHYSNGPAVVQWTLGSSERYLMFTKRHFDGTPCLLMLRDIICLV